MKLHQGLRTYIVVLLLLISGSMAMADETLVEVHHLQDNLAPYKERRSDHGAYFGLGYEGLELVNYVSTLDGKYYGELFSTKPVGLLKLNVEYKYNMVLGSLAGGLEYGTGEVTGTDSGEERSLTVSKIGASFRYTADNIFAEPYVAPFVGLSVWQLDLNEKSPTDSFGATTQIGYNYTVGVLLQLDWIDYNSAKESTFTYGLENTFLEIYATQYAKTSADEDPDTETDLLYGGGLKFEF